MSCVHTENKSYSWKLPLTQYVWTDFYSSSLSRTCTDVCGSEVAVAHPLPPQLGE